ENSVQAGDIPGPADDGQPLPRRSDQAACAESHARPPDQSLLPLQPHDRTAARTSSQSTWKTWQETGRITAHIQQTSLRESQPVLFYSPTPFPSRKPTWLMPVSGVLPRRALGR